MVELMMYIGVRQTLEATSQYKSEGTDDFLELSWDEVYAIYRDKLATEDDLTNENS